MSKFSISICALLCTWIYAAESLLQIGDFCISDAVVGDRKTRESANRSAELASCDPSVPLECITGRCQCKRGYTINRNGTHCLEIARNGLESPCEESIQCWKGLLGRLSECHSPTGKCQCYESETLPIVFHQGRCYYGESLGDYCQIEGLCTATTINATCKTGVCQCKDGYVPSWDKSRCLPISTQGINSSCEENIQCEKSILGTLSECNQESMRCQCYQIPMVPTVFHSGRCYFGASLGDVCQVSAQCTATTESSICGSDGKCRCNETDGFVPDSVGVTCLPIVSGDDASTSECLEDIQCTRTLGHFSRCNPKQRKCECFTPEDNLQLTEKDEKPMVIVGAKCYEAKGIGEICKYNQECAVFTRNSICVNETCQCEPEGYVLAGGVDGKRCLEIGMDGLGSPCEEDVQCTHSILGPLARCDPLMKNCTCSNILPVVYYDKACFFHRQLGTPCESNLECKAAGNYFAECIEERCHCRHGMESAGQSCIPSTSESRSGGSIPYSGFYSLIITCLALMYK